MKNKEVNCIYYCKNNIDLYEYKRMVSYFPEIYWYFVLRLTFLNLVLFPISVITSNHFGYAFGMFIIFQVIIMILCKVKLDFFAEKLFKISNKGNIDIDTEFYEEYIIRITDIQTNKIFYSDIIRAIETSTNFYLKSKSLNVTIILQKGKCDLEIISFIREKLPNLENHLGNSSKFSGVKQYSNGRMKQFNLEKVNYFMTFLFIVTIATIWGSLYSLSLLDLIVPQNDLNYSKNAWIIWCWLPIPIASIILGNKYRCMGYSCKKNIIAGYTVAIILLLCGSFALFPTDTVSYDKISPYKEYIDANLPDNGELSIMHLNTYYDKTDYTILKAYYDKEDIMDLVKSIENSENWILSNKIKSDLKIFIPSLFEVGDYIYYSIYNKTINEYNKLPDESGDCNIYAMMYNKKAKYLEIHKFDYLYKK